LVGGAGNILAGKLEVQSV